MIVFIDGDILVYSCSWGCDTSEEALEKYELRIKEICSACYSDNYIVAIQGRDNFRTKFFSEYKQTNSRAKVRDTHPLAREFRKFLIKNTDVIPSDGMEADDLLCMWSYKYTQKGKDFVVASSDKDLLCIEGIHLRLRGDKILHVSKEDAEKHYWSQILQGDATDNIQGLPGIGPIKAGRILDSGIKDNYKETVIQTYKNFYGDDWFNKLNHTGTLIHLLRYEGDKFII